MANYGDNPFAPGMTSDAYIPDQLIAGDLKLVTESVTIAAGANLVRGSVLGVVTATGKFKLSATAAGDGSEVPVAILADAAAAAGVDVVAGVYLTGEFNERAVTLGAGWTTATAKAALRDRTIYLKATDSAADPT